MADVKKAAEAGKKKEETSSDNVNFGSPLEEERTLLLWRALGRPYKKRTRDFYTSMGAIAFLTSVILAFFREFLAIMAGWALVFFAYTLSKTEPEKVEHSITTRGIKTGKNKYLWGELVRFWFEKKWGQNMLMVDTYRAFPGRLILLLGDTPEEKIKNILVKRVMYDRPEDTFMDKATKWLQKKIPLEEEETPKVTSPTK